MQHLMLGFIPSLYISTICPVLRKCNDWIIDLYLPSHTWDPCNMEPFKTLADFFPPPIFVPWILVQIAGHAVQPRHVLKVRELKAVKDRSIHAFSEGHVTYRRRVTFF